jgi:predicted DCC family thiol-disulfide oxidoreductase YuxK
MKRGPGRHNGTVTTVPEFPTFLYDGDCAFCSSSARFAQRWIPTAAVIAPWQFSPIDEFGVTLEEVDVAVVWVTSPTQHCAGPEAIATLLTSSRSAPWRLAGWLLARRLVLRAAWPLYRWVAVNRHRMPGGTAECSLPHAERGRSS